MLKALHAQKDRAAAHAREIAAKFEKFKWGNIVMLVHNVVSEDAHVTWVSEHALAADSDQQPMERTIREIRRRTWVVGAFPDGQSALVLVAARRRHVAATHWGPRRHLVVKLLYADEARSKIASQPAGVTTEGAKGR